MGLPSYIVPIMGKSSFSNLYSTSLDGINEYATMGDNNVFSFGDGSTDSPFSMSVWVKITSINVFGTIIGKAPNNNTIWEYKLFVANNGTIVLWCMSTGGSIYQGRSAPAGTATTGTWMHLCATYDGLKANGQKIYKNGIRVDTANSNSLTYTGMSNTTGSFALSDYVGFPFHGLIFNAALWNKELTLAEVGEIYTLKGGDLRTTSCNSNLVEAWKYNNGTSDYPIITGYKNGYNGTMTNQESSDISTDIPT